MLKMMHRLAFLAAGLLVPVGLGAQSLVGGAPRDASQVTFARDIAPILQRSCQQCHRPASVAPMSLLTYEEVRPWARAIKARTALRNKRGAMPPWFIEKDIGIQHYKNDPSLTEDEIEKIAIWADSGAPLGDPSDLPPPLDFGDEDKWAIGEPDLVLKGPEVVVPAAMPDKWTSLGNIDPGMTEDRYVAAIEVREVNNVPKESASGTVGGRFVFHHLGWDSVMPNGDVLHRWPVHEVGRNSDVFPPEVGQLLPAGSLLHMRTAHLHANGRDTRAHLEFAFKFRPRGYEPEQTYTSVGPANGVDVDMQANQADQELHAYLILEEHTKIVLFEPHQHAPGTRMCLEAIWGHNIQQLTCAGYDHNWVRQYAYEDDYAPLLPKGTILHLIGWHDTTAANRNVVDPRNWSGGGRRSVANMFLNLGRGIELTDEQFEREMAERRDRLQLKKNDYLIGCPLCQVEFPSQATSTDNQ